MSGTLTRHDNHAFGIRIAIPVSPPSFREAISPRARRISAGQGGDYGYYLIPLSIESVHSAGSVVCEALTIDGAI